MKTRSLLIGFLTVLAFAASCSDGGEGPGFGPDPELTAVCGNGTIEAGESCDDGNAVADDGCDELCRTECSEGMLCAASVPPLCGNGQLENGEECDDGNTRNGDGCGMLCRTEVVPPPSCGNLRVETGEECDGIVGTTPGHRCNTSCRLEIVTNPCSGIAAITVSGPSSQNCNAGENCSMSFTASGGSGNFRWTARNLPEGMSLPSAISGATIQVSGRPSAGSRTFTITAGAAECSSASVSKDVTVNVAETIRLRLYRWNRSLASADKWEEVRKTTSGVNGKPRLQGGSSTGTGTGASGTMIYDASDTFEFLEQPTWGRFYKLEVAGSSASSFTWQHTPTGNSEICLKGTEPPREVMNQLPTGQTARTCASGSGPAGRMAYLYLTRDRADGSRFSVRVSANSPSAASQIHRSVSFTYSSPPPAILRRSAENISVRILKSNGHRDRISDITVRVCKDKTSLLANDAANCVSQNKVDGEDNSLFGEVGNLAELAADGEIFFSITYNSSYFWVIRSVELRYDEVRNLEGGSVAREGKIYWNPCVHKALSPAANTLNFSSNDVAACFVAETTRAEDRGDSRGSGTGDIYLKFNGSGVASLDGLDVYGSDDVPPTDNGRFSFMSDMLAMGLSNWFMACGDHCDGDDSYRYRMTTDVHGAHIFDPPAEAFQNPARANVRLYAPRGTDPWNVRFWVYTYYPGQTFRPSGDQIAVVDGPKTLYQTQPRQSEHPLGNVICDRCSWEFPLSPQPPVAISQVAPSGRAGAVQYLQTQVPRGRWSDM